MADENKKANYAGIELWKLSVPELEKLLYSGSHLPDDGADEDFYDALEEVLLRKEQENPSGRLPDPSKAWADFQTEYTHFPAASSCYALSSAEKPTQKSASHRSSYKHKFFQHLASTAAVLAAVILSMIVVQASGIDILGAIARWTEDTFHFESTNSYTEESSPVMHLQESIGLLGIPESLAPTGIPEHYEIESISTTENTDFRLFACIIMDSDESAVSLTIVQRLSQNAQEFDQYEKDAEDVEEYHVSGRIFYLFSNNCTVTAMLSDGQYSISIVGDMTVHNMQQILNSLYGGN